jgi:hypothetical protein
MLETRVFFGPTPKATREYAEWFASLVFETVEVSVAVRPFVEGGSETVIIVVYLKHQ